jgi:hypothetical protein
MSIPYSETPDEESEFASMRDSFYILMNLNQFKMKPVISMTREAEGLLRIVLFSKELRLIDKKKTLSQMRRRLAQDLRSNRRRGVVPIFISTLWFILALAISIEAGKSLLLFISLVAKRDQHLAMSAAILRLTTSLWVCSSRGCLY